MDAGRLRRADPRLLAALCYATVTGIATEPEALRAVGWDATTVGLRRLRAELLAFLRAALTVQAQCSRFEMEHLTCAHLPSRRGDAVGRSRRAAQVRMSHIAPKRADRAVSTCARRRWT